MSTIRCVLAGFFIAFATDAFGQPFTEVSASSGLVHRHTVDETIAQEALFIAAGGTVGDYDADGDIDIYLVGGGESCNALFRNNGDGSFSDVTDASGTGLCGIYSSGPIFTDTDGDGDLDLLVFSVHRFAAPMGSDPNQLENRPRLFLNDGDGVFHEGSGSSGFMSGMPSFGGSLADLDRDGDLDLFMTHWVASDQSFEFFWENDGNGVFSDVTIGYLGDQMPTLDRFSFTPNITDINNDSWPDVLLASDFGTTRKFISNGLDGNGQLSFDVVQPDVLSDENGMGASVADYDNDGDMDWFVTSIWDPDGIAEGNWGVTGNRLYNNDGNGNFTDVTDLAGVREGYWGWASCFADFNNDGYLDIYHENGFPIPIAQEFVNDPARLFMANGDGSFTELSASSGLQYTGQGRGVSCFDYDLDGDIDILVMPNDDDVLLYRNDLNNGNHYLTVLLDDESSNSSAIGAKITLHGTFGLQTREVTAGSNFVSNNGFRQHFGLGINSSPQSLEVHWPDGENLFLAGPVPIDQTLIVGRHCSTNYLLMADIDETVDLGIRVYAPDGRPPEPIDVQLSIGSGPNNGTILSDGTDSSGFAHFTMTGFNPGSDQLEYVFQLDGQFHSCQAWVEWTHDSMLFRSGFE